MTKLHYYAKKTLLNLMSTAATNIKSIEKFGTCGSVGTTFSEVLAMTLGVSFAKNSRFHLSRALISHPSQRIGLKTQSAVFLRNWGILGVY